jgi:hypothetical protein
MKGVFHMNYEKIYQDLCNRGKTRSKKDGIYLEKHHIIPTFFFKKSKRKHRYSDGIFEGNPDAIGNICYLTAREHFIAHILLCKIWSNTKWYHRCKSSLLFFFNREDSLHERNKHFKPGETKRYEKIRLEAIKSISKERTGTMPVKDVKTGEMIGSVSVDHPKVLSGEWVHHSKGVPLTQKRKDELKIVMQGFGNTNSKYSDEEIVKSYLECCEAYDMIVSMNFWVDYSMKHNKPYLKIFKKFRLNGGGFKDLIDIAKQNNFRLPGDGKTRPFYSKEYKDFLRRNTWD